MTVEEKRAYDRARYLAKSEKLLAQHAEWRENNKERVKNYSKSWFQENKERLRDVRRKWSAANRERRNEKQRERNRANPELQKGYQRRWKERNPDSVRALYLSRRSKKKFPSSFIIKLRRLQNDRCIVCLVGLTSGFHVDHITPVTMGGEHELDNFQLLCAPCNQAKAGKDPIEFMQSRGFLL